MCLNFTECLIMLATDIPSVFLLLSGHQLQHIKRIVYIIHYTCTWINMQCSPHTLFFPYTNCPVKWTRSQHLPILRMGPCHPQHRAWVCLRGKHIYIHHICILVYHHPHRQWATQAQLSNGPLTEDSSTQTPPYNTNSHFKELLWVLTNTYGHQQ